MARCMVLAQCSNIYRMLLQFIARKPLVWHQFCQPRAKLRRARSSVFEALQLAPQFIVGGQAIYVVFQPGRRNRGVPFSNRRSVSHDTSAVDDCDWPQLPAGEPFGNYATRINTVFTPCVKTVLTSTNLLDRLSRWKLSLTMTT